MISGLSIRGGVTIESGTVDIDNVFVTATPIGGGTVFSNGGSATLSQSVLRDAEVFFASSSGSLTIEHVDFQQSDVSAFARQPVNISDSCFELGQSNFIQLDTSVGSPVVFERNTIRRDDCSADEAGLILDDGAHTITNNLFRGRESCTSVRVEDSGAQSVTMTDNVFEADLGLDLDVKSSTAIIGADSNTWSAGCENILVANAASFEGSELGCTPP